LRLRADGNLYQGGGIRSSPRDEVTPTETHEHRQIIAPHAKPRRHGVDAVITARKEHVAGCDRSGDQGGKAVVDRLVSTGGRPVFAGAGRYRVAVGDSEFLGSADGDFAMGQTCGL
jgi:hypothetical protein